MNLDGIVLAPDEILRIGRFIPVQIAEIGGESGDGGEIKDVDERAGVGEGGGVISASEDDGDHVVAERVAELLRDVVATE